MTDEPSGHTIVTADELREGDVLFADRAVTVANVVSLLNRAVLVTWRHGTDTWDNVYGAKRSIQLASRGPKPE
ncbi:hypothetical protein [Streptomyces sp. NPDC005302]|uniref:hypothetical protein n=1 Tax=Streptomyces sp. NPDC005302 TaxID=3154675 RepID=UPI0033A8434F